MGFENIDHLKIQEQEVTQAHPLDILPSLTLERREDILEIVEFCGRCVDRYVKEFNIEPIPQDAFFLFGGNKVDSLGMYDPKTHMFGIHEKALYMPHVLIHEMIHFIAVEKLTRQGGYQYQANQENTGESKTVYLAVDEGMTDLMAQEIYSLNYPKLKNFFAGRGGMERIAGEYSEETIFIQKLVEYNAIILSIQEKIPQEEAHIQVWREMKRAYLSNNHTYLEDLFSLFAETQKEEMETKQFIQEIQPSRDQKKKTELLIEILDKKITSLRTWKKQIDI